MAHASVKLNPGVDQNETPALNETGISTSNLIRFIPDRVQGALTQKLGGWTKYPNSGQAAMPAVVRALWAWEDTNANSHLAVGTGNSASNVSYLAVFTGNTSQEITPTTLYDDTTVAVSTTVGSSTVTITDAVTANISSLDTVYIVTPISVGGLILSGLYSCTNISSTQYSITATNVLGAPLGATSSVVAGGAVPQYTTTSGSSVVTVTFNDHTYVNGDTFAALISTTVGGVTIFGNYIVSGVASTTFYIQVASNATSSTSAYMNGGNARYIYSKGTGGAVAGTGYGYGTYDGGDYGTGNGGGVAPGTGDKIPSTDWTLDNWGEILLACSHETTIDDVPFTPVYSWSPISGQTTANIIPESPPVNEGIFTAMPQRQIIAYGSTDNGIQDPLLIRWCDVNDYNSWIALPTNQAGEYRVPKGSKIIGGIQGPQQGLIWTDLAIWAMQYVGLPYVYQFNEIATGCGLIAKKAATSLGGIVYWMGASQFYMLGPNGVQPVVCPIWDVIFQDLDTSAAALKRIRVAANSRFGEIAWYYPSKSNGGEVTNYVKYNVNLQKWDYGTLTRTAWINESVLGPPIGAGVLPGSTGSYLVQHETSPDAVNSNGVAVAMSSSFRTGYFTMQEGDLKTFIDQVWPDFKWGYFGGTQNAEVQLQFFYTDYAGQTPQSSPIFTMTQDTTYITPRIRGRLVSISISSSDIGSFWRIGNVRYRLQPDGKY